MALAVVGGAALSGFFQQVFVKLDSQEVKNFIRGKKLTNGLLEKLNIELMYVDAVYDDAEQKQLRDPRVKQWLHKLKEAVFRAEDLLDEIKTEALRRQIEEEFGSSTSKVQDIFASFHAFDESLDTRIEEILERLSFISKQKDVFGLKERCSHRISQTLPLTSLVEASDVYGRDHDKETIIQLLLSNDVNKIGVIPIVGMGGIGKTTLAQLLYNDDRVKQRFDLQAWVCVSVEFDVVKITQTIYASVTSQTCDTRDLNQLQVKLKDALKGKKFLFVLDDVWNENYNIWDSLRRPFESGAPGSKIIVTSRNDGVASTMGNLQTHYLKHLLEEDCWFLFSKHAFKDASVDPNLEVIGRQIVSKCKGLPLAAKSLGGLLRSESNVKEWENLLKSDIWELSDAKIDILPSLWLSYQYLSLMLKRCFAYCSIFPKGYRFHKSELILLWMAEDLLHPQKKTMLEDVGEKYFDDLISRSFFQYSSSNDCFIMHDLMHDLAAYVCGEFCIRLEDHDFSLDVVRKGRHFCSMQYSSEVVNERIHAIYNAKYLRTFILGYLYPLSKVRLDHLSKLQCLRVLKLLGHGIRELPDSISNLKYLRYLDLYFASIQKLPDTVCSLYNLQTLLLSNCALLIELPTDLRRLINLRHLDIRRTQKKKMPPHLDKLNVLQIFGGEFVLSEDDGGNIDELKGFQHLRDNLHISGLQNVKRAEDALEAKLRDNKLSEIRLKWEGVTIDSQNDSRVLGNLQPNTNLKVLAIEGYRGSKFPDWLGDESFSNLITLRLKTCGYCLTLPALGQLSSLKKLEIDGLNGVESVGSEFYGRIKPAFKSLEFLSFCDMREWQKWCFPGGEEEGGHFPNLCKLSLHCCPKLTGKIPLDYFPRLEWLSLHEVNIESLGCSQECNNFRIELPSLLKLEISGCPNLVCFVGGGVLRAPNLKEISMCRFKNLWSVPEDMQISLPSLQSLFIEGCKEFKSFPEESKFLSLNVLVIMECPEFVSFPHGGGLHAPNLKRMKIRKCNKFRSLPEEMHASLPSLQFLSIEGCEEFKSFSEESKFPSLDDLEIFQCPEFVGFPHGGGLHAPNLKKMEIKGCNKFRSLPEEMHASLPSLQSLYIAWCKEFKSFPEESKFPSLDDLIINWCPEFVGFPHGGGLHAPNLKKMGICGCNKFMSLPEEMHASLPSLQSLSIEWCKEFKSFPEESKFPSLDDLKIIGCPEFVGFPHGGGLHAPNLKKMEICGKFRSLPEEMHAFLSSLLSLSIEGCKDFKSFPEESKFASLKYLRIRKCPEFVGFPHGGGLQAPNLKTMGIYDCNKFRSLPAEKHASLPSLKSLKIWDCPELESFPEGGLPSKLCTLDIRSCKKLMANRMRWGLQTLTSLKDLHVDFSKCEEREIGESFPEEGLLPTTLTSLGIAHHPNLKTIDGKALRHLISLETLNIYYCPQLQSLPDEGLPTSLSRLYISQCDLLTQRCQQDTGEDWAKISHIPNVIIDNRKI